jgi:hypothetical protein
LQGIQKTRVNEDFLLSPLSFTTTRCGIERYGGGEGVKEKNRNLVGRGNFRRGKEEKTYIGLIFLGVLKTVKVLRMKEFTLWGIYILFILQRKALFISIILQ